MTTETAGQGRDEQLAAAVRLRESGLVEEARQRLVALAAAHPADAVVAYQAAWAHDALGQEAEAVPYYEQALAGDGLAASERQGALLGLGSTYRTLGRYGEAVATLRRGVAEFPEDGALRAFLAMALYNTGEHREAMRLLLTLLTATSGDQQIQDFRRAIDLYAEDLDRTWS